MITYTDNSQMPFGAHQGKRLEDVPASYLIYLWENMYKNQATENQPLSIYIQDNLQALKIEQRERNKNKNR